MKKRQIAIILTAMFCMGITAFGDYKKVSADTGYYKSIAYNEQTLYNMSECIENNYLTIEQSEEIACMLSGPNDTTEVIEIEDNTTSDTVCEVETPIGTVISEYTSAYIPQATIKISIGENGSVATTYFKSGKVFDYNIDEYLVNVDEVELLYHLVQAEGGNQSSLARRLIADCVLNQRDSGKYPDTIKGVILTPGDFEVVATGSIFKVTPSESTIECVNNELETRIDYAVMYFRTKHFHTFGVPYDQVGDCYFSKPQADDSSQWSE